MKVSRARSECGGLTLVEVLAAIAIVALIAALLLPAGVNRSMRSRLLACQNHQQRLVLGLIMFKSDHADKYPWQISATISGSTEPVGVNQVFPCYRPLSNYLGQATGLFLCPTDGDRSPATTFPQIVDTNISYFLNRDAVPGGLSILGGDRHLEADGKPLGHGSFIYSTNLVMRWTKELHNAPNGPVGVLSFADGHVQAARRDELNAIFQNQQRATNHLVIP
jgi:prepilin-type N-terminal cleavage/methylation domain-containing protein